MPNPVLINLWSCNIWDREVDRETAVDTEALHDQFPYRPGQIQAVPLGSDGHEVSQGAFERYEMLTDGWPEVPPVIDPSLHVTKQQDDAVRTYRNAKTEDEAERASKLECYDRADYQLHLAHYGTTDRPTRDPKNWQLLTEVVMPEGVADQVDIGETVGAVEYLKEVLPQGRPVLVGVRLSWFPDRPNDLKSTPSAIEPTNHFVVIVGMGVDDHGPYFSYYDYMKRPSDQERMHLYADMKIASKGEERHLVQVRRSWRKR
jgi:hypothetical protein